MLVKAPLVNVMGPAIGSCFADAIVADLLRYGTLSTSHEQGVVQSQTLQVNVSKRQGRDLIVGAFSRTFNEYVLLVVPPVMSCSNYAGLIFFFCRRTRHF